MIANAASFVLPILTPANLLVFWDGMSPLGQWLLAFGMPSVLAIGVTCWVLRMVFKKDMVEAIEGTLVAGPLSEDGKLVVEGPGVMVAVLLVASAGIIASKAGVVQWQNVSFPS